MKMHSIIIKSKTQSSFTQMKCILRPIKFHPDEMHSAPFPNAHQITEVQNEMLIKFIKAIKLLTPHKSPDALCAGPKCTYSPDEMLMKMIITFIKAITLLMPHNSPDALNPQMLIKSR